MLVVCLVGMLMIVAWSTCSCSCFGWNDRARGLVDVLVFALCFGWRACSLVGTWFGRSVSDRGMLVYSLSWIGRFVRVRGVIVLAILLTCS